MKRRGFLGTILGFLGLSTAALACPRCEKGTPVPHPGKPAKGPFSIEIISPPEESGRELPLFDTYKTAENFAQARMHLLRSNTQIARAADVPKHVHEAGNIKIWSAENKVVYECSWGETWTMAQSYVDCHGRNA